MTEESQDLTSPAEREEAIVRYLLAELSEEDRARMEERLAQEPSFFDVVESVEDELIMQFVRGDLDSHKLSRFNEVYMNDPAKRARVESACAWRQAAREVAGGRGALNGNLGRLCLAAMATATAVIAIGMLWSSLRKPPAQPQPKVVRPSQFTAETPYASFLLEPGLTRSSGGTQIKVPAGISEVHFELVAADSSAHKTYIAVLGTPERPAAWTGPVSPKDAGFLAVVPAQVLRPGDYTLEVQGEGEDVATYSFRVAR
jgi:hypothetical protein